MFREFRLGDKIERETLGINSAYAYEKVMADKNIKDRLEGFFVTFEKSLRPELKEKFPILFGNKTDEQIRDFLKENFQKAVISPEKLLIRLEELKNKVKINDPVFQTFNLIKTEIKKVVDIEFMEDIIKLINDPEKVKRPFNISLVQNLSNKLKSKYQNSNVLYYSAVLDAIDKKTQIDAFNGTDAFLYIDIDNKRHKFYIDVTGDPRKVSKKEGIKVEKGDSKIRIYFDEEYLAENEQNRIGKEAANRILEMIDK